MAPSEPAPRVAGPADVDAVVEVITSAFNRDPVWSWAFPDDASREAQHRVFWRPFVAEAVPHGWVWTTPASTAASVWLPPGVPEFSPEAEAELEPMLVDLLGDDGAATVFEVFDLFAAARPAEPHYYLSLLGTHGDHRGGGIGMGLLAANVAAIDATGTPAYLESTNPANDARYERAGFERIGEFELPGDGPVVAMMWRDPPG